MRSFAFVAGLLISGFCPAADPPLAGAVIVVDPGHGGQRYSKSYTGGTRGIASKLTESELNLRVSLELEKILKTNGAEVHLTRTADHRLSREGSSNVDELHARIDFFEHHNCHFFLSVHHNAGGETATGHTALWKHNAKDDTLYESLARAVNDALEGAVPGPKRPLIGKRGNYHILRETDIPGTIAESGFMTNRAFDDLCNRPEYPKTEAEAIAKGAMAYWATHKKALIALRDKLSADRKARPRDPKAVTAIALSEAFRTEVNTLLGKIAPGGVYDPASANDYVEAFRRELVTDPKAVFTVKASTNGRKITLAGEVSDRKYHDKLIDLFVAMKLFDLTNEMKLPAAKKLP